MNEEKTQPVHEPGTRERMFGLGLVVLLIVGAGVSIWFNISGWTMMLAAFGTVAAVYGVARWPLGSAIAFVAIGWTYGSLPGRSGRVTELTRTETSDAALTAVVALVVWAVLFAVLRIVVRVVGALQAARNQSDTEGPTR